MRRVTEPQAKRLAWLWAHDRTTSVSRTGYVDATVKACIKRGWLAPTGKLGRFPNGELFEEHAVSIAGLDAIEDYLRVSRQERVIAERREK